MQENKTKKKNKYLWTELFRPVSVSDVIMPKAYKKTFEKLVKEKEIPNLLLSSSTPGSGKCLFEKEEIEVEIEEEIYFKNRHLFND